jgi:hypothetical protein
MANVEVFRTEVLNECCFARTGDAHNSDNDIIWSFEETLADVIDIGHVNWTLTWAQQSGFETPLRQWRAFPLRKLRTEEAGLLWKRKRSWFPCSREI